MKELRGKKALITGAASGIGRCLALALAKEGTDLFLLDIDSAGLAEVAGEVTTAGVEVDSAICDLAQPAQIARSILVVLERWGTLDILINNAGIAWYGPTERMPEADWDRLLQINLLAPIQLTRALLPMLLSRPEAHILNVCSIAGLVAGRKLNAYHTSKFGLVGFSEALRAEFSARGLGVTALCPGLVQTPLLHKAAPGRKLPGWLCAAPEGIARQGVAAIRRNRGLVLVTPMARLLWYLKRLAPGLIDFVNGFQRKKWRTPVAPQPTAYGPRSPVHKEQIHGCR